MILRYLVGPIKSQVDILRYLVGPIKTHIDIIRFSKILNCPKQKFWWVLILIDGAITMRQSSMLTLMIVPWDNHDTDYCTMWQSWHWLLYHETIISVNIRHRILIAAFTAAEEFVWLPKLLYKKKHNIYLFIGNQSTLKLMKKPAYHKRTNHIDIRFDHRNSGTKPWMSNVSTLVIK